MFRSTIRFLGLGVLAAVLSAPVAQACTCMGGPTAELLALADMVFYGTVLSRENLPSRFSDQGEYQWADVRFELRVEGGWKGARADTIAIYSSRQESACGYRLEVGTRYLVFAYVSPKRHGLGVGPPPALETDRCSGTMLLEGAEERVTALGPLTWGPMPTGFVAPKPPVYRELPVWYRDR